MKVTRTIRASPDAVLSAASEPIVTRFADPVDAKIEGNRVRWLSLPDFIEKVDRSAEVRFQDGSTELTLRAAGSLSEPYFGWLIGPFVRRRIRRDLIHMADLIRARATGQPPPKTPRRPVWAPPDRLDAAQSKVIMAVCAVLAITTYGGSLLTHTVDFVAKTFGASDADLGTLLAITRIGTLVAVMGSTVADKRGRRWVLLIATTGTSLTSLASAFAPNIVVFGALQILSRGFVNLATVVGLIAVTEESSEGSRAYMLGIAAILAAVGFSLGAVLLPLADVTPEAWRGLYGVGALGLLVVPSISRRLTETKRFASMEDRIQTASAREVIDQTYGGRFAIVAAANFLLAMLAAPSSQFMNRYLADARGYSGGDILAIRAFAQGLPALFAVFIGGRMAESSGRKPVAARATVAMAVTTAAFYLTGGAAMWTMLLVSSVAAGLSGPAVAAFNTELFPTEVRGRAGAALLTVAVLGSVTGVLIAGHLAGPLGGIGASVGLTSIGAIIVGLFLIQRLPEARGRDLDEVSPPEV